MKPSCAYRSQTEMNMLMIASLPLKNNYIPMKKEQNPPIVEEYLKSLNGMQPAEPKDFLYDRLINKLENEQQDTSWIFPLRPVWMVSALLVLLALNTLLLTEKRKTSKVNEPASIEGFAQAYDLQISSY
jgi:hypothetical protein